MITSDASARGVRLVESINDRVVNRGCLIDGSYFVYGSLIKPICSK